MKVRQAQARLLRQLPLLALAAAVAWMAGCSSPTPLDPGGDPGFPENPDSSCSGVLPVFNPFPNGFASVGTDTTLDIATWNMEFFPLDLPGDYDCGHAVDLSREQEAADIINTLKLDVIAVEEISDSTGFYDMLDLCPNYEGIVSPEPHSSRDCNFQRPGIIFRSDQVTVHSTELLFTDDNNAFPRAAFQVDLTVAARGRSIDLHVIVIHLKASGGDENIARRRAAAIKLEQYLADQSAADPHANYMIAGDWNDVLETPLSTNPFAAFLGDSDNYKFLDQSMAGDRSMASEGGSLIDHLLINQAACADFAAARVATLRLDILLPVYKNVSDHRPVMVQAPIFR